MNPTIPVSPFGPQGGMATANPAANPQLFTRRPDGPIFPAYEPPGALMTAKEAFALLNQLSLWGVTMPQVIVYQASDNGGGKATWLAPSDNDPARRHYYTGTYRGSDLEDEQDLMLVRRALGGVMCSPVAGLAAIAAERGVSPIRLGYITSEEIVAALRAIFG